MSAPYLLKPALQELHKLTGRSRWLFPGVGSRNPVISRPYFLNTDELSSTSKESAVKPFRNLNKIQAWISYID